MEHLFILIVAGLSISLFMIPVMTISAFLEKESCDKEALENQIKLLLKLNELEKQATTKKQLSHSK